MSNIIDARSGYNPFIEVSRRILPLQRDLFKFLKPLEGILTTSDFVPRNLDRDVRVNLVSRFDAVKAQDFKATADRNSDELEELLQLKDLASCDERTTVLLGEPVLSNKGDGWQAIEMPIVDSDYPITDERTAVTNKFDEVTDEVGMSIWYPETPALQVVEFRAETDMGAKVLEWVTHAAPTETELFEASIRFRSPIV